MTKPLVVVGDTLLDVDLEGHAGRLSPDAPVPVLDHLVEHARPGGAGLAAAIAASRRHPVVLVTALGRDPAGEQVAELLEAAGVQVLRLPHEGPTPVKKRVRAGGQSLLRLDSGSAPGSVGAPTSDVARALSEAGSVLVADYGRGVTSNDALREMLARVPNRVPVVWDPHPRGATPVSGARLVTPNQAEAAQFAREHDCAGPPDLGELASVGRQAAGLQQAWQAQAVVVTLGARGALLSYGDGAPAVTPAPPVLCLDPCGAGDVFATTASLALGRGLVTTEAVQEAVWAATEYVAAGGPASVFGSGSGTGFGSAVPGSNVAGRNDRDARPEALDLARTVSSAGGVVVATGGCFDLLHAGHVATLREARKLGDCLVVCLNSDDSVRRLKGPTRPLVCAEDRARVLQALEYVDAVVVFDEDTPVEVIRKLRPDVWAKGGDYAGTDVPEAAVLEEWGGQAVVLPYLNGRSTSDLVRSAADGRSASAVVAEQPRPLHKTTEGDLT